MRRFSNIQRREFALFAQSNPDMSKWTPAQRESVAGFLGIQPSALESAHAYAWQQPQPGGGPADAELAMLSPLDRRVYALRNSSGA